MRSVWLIASLIGTFGVTVSCSRDKRPGDGGPGVGAPGAIAKSETQPTGTPAHEPSPPPVAPLPPPDGDPAAPAVEAAKTEALSWGLGELQDLGPAGPASAWARGVSMVNKQSELLLLPLRKDGRFEELDASTASFAKYGRGPAVTERFAYWIDLGGHLLRAPLSKPKEVERLHSTARSGTRVAALASGDRELVAFVAELEDDPTSMLWSSSGELLRVSPEGSSATSVDLVPLGRGALVLTHEGRTGMSPVHARSVRLARRRVSLGDDRVVWVGPGSHPLTELEAVSTAPGRTLTFIAAARTITDFGLARFATTEALEPVDETQWTAYPNGIDPAPVAAAALCGGHHVFFAVPSTARPRSPQELRVARLREDAVEGAETLVRARAFNDISVAPRPGGAILVWTADRRTWATTLLCPSSKKDSKED